MTVVSNPALSSPSVVLRAIWQAAEKCCTNECALNRFWDLHDVVWLCTKCRVWYHLDCCKVTGGKKEYQSLEDCVNTPLLKGGGFGWTGTAPFVFAAIEAVQKMKAGGGTDAANELNLQECIGEKADTWLEMMRKGSILIGTEITCPACCE